MAAGVSNPSTTPNRKKITKQFSKSAKISEIINWHGNRTFPISTNYITMSLDKLMAAQFESMRFQILTTKLNTETESKISDAYAYAWYERIYPYFSDSKFHESVEDNFSISYDEMERISEIVDRDWREDQVKTFYEYEKSLGDRVTLLKYFRYSYLLDHFDDNFWKKLLTPMEHPSEATLIVKESIEFYLE